MLSGNICLLKRVCEIMSKQNNVNNNSTEAMRILLAVEIMLSPSSIALPSIPATVAAKNYLTDKYATSSAVAIDLSSLTGTASASSASSLGLVLDMRKDNRESSSNKRDEEVNVEKKSSNSMKRNRNEDLLDNQNTNEGENEEIDVNDKKRLKNTESLSSSSLFVPNESISVAFGNPKNREVTKNNGREDEINDDDDDDDDDDDSLPDIDINADPEQ